MAFPEYALAMFYVNFKLNHAMDPLPLSTPEFIQREILTLLSTRTRNNPSNFTGSGPSAMSRNPSLVTTISPSVVPEISAVIVESQPWVELIQSKSARIDDLKQILGVPMVSDVMRTEIRRLHQTSLKHHQTLNIYNNVCQLHRNFLRSNLELKELQFLLLAKSTKKRDQSERIKLKAAKLLQDRMTKLQPNTTLPATIHSLPTQQHPLSSIDDDSKRVDTECTMRNQLAPLPSFNFNGVIPSDWSNSSGFMREASDEITSLLEELNAMSLQEALEAIDAENSSVKLDISLAKDSIPPGQPPHSHAKVVESIAATSLATTATTPNSNFIPTSNVPESLQLLPKPKSGSILSKTPQFTPISRQQEPHLTPLTASGKSSANNSSKQLHELENKIARVSVSETIKTINTIEAIHDIDVQLSKLPKILNTLHLTDPPKESAHLPSQGRQTSPPPSPSFSVNCASNDESQVVDRENIISIENRPSTRNSNDRNHDFDLASSKVKAVVQVLYAYNAASSDELSLKVNSLISVFDTNGDWWLGKCESKCGLFPSNYTRTVCDMKSSVVPLFQAINNCFSQQVICAPPIIIHFLPLFVALFIRRPTNWN